MPAQHLTSEHLLVPQVGLMPEYIQLDSWQADHLLHRNTGKYPAATNLPKATLSVAAFIAPPHISLLVHSYSTVICLESVQTLTDQYLEADVQQNNLFLYMVHGPALHLHLKYQNPITITIKDHKAESPHSADRCAVQSIEWMAGI